MQAAALRPFKATMTRESDGTTDFGFETVPLIEKQARVNDVFRSVARRYDLMNDLMSAGLHRAWKDALVTTVNPPPKGRPGRLNEKAKDTPFALLDLAGGTGDIAFRLAAHGAAHVQALSDPALAVPLGDLAAHHAGAATDAAHHGATLLAQATDPGAAGTAAASTM